MTRAEVEPRPPAAVLDALFGKAHKALDAYVDLLTSAGVDRGLLGPREAGRIWSRHILNCAVVAPALPPQARVCDLGSGAGLPGIVVALARPDVSVVLLEPLLRRATFLQEVLDTVPLPQCSVLRSRAEDLGAPHEFDVVMARAVAPLERLGQWSAPLLKPGGLLLALKGDRAADEAHAAAATLAACGFGPPQMVLYGTGVVAPATVVVQIASGRPGPSPCL